jgi:hypothetical protein
MVLFGGSLRPGLCHRLPQTLASPWSSKGSGWGFCSSSQSPHSPPMFSVSSLVNLRCYGLVLVVQWQLRVLLGCQLCSGMARESLNEVRFILTRRHRVPELGDKYNGQGPCPPQSSPHGTTLCIWSQCNINFLSSGFPQMQNV